MGNDLYVHVNTHGWNGEGLRRGVGGWGRDPFSRNFMKPTPRRKWYLTTGCRFHWMVLDPIPQSFPVHFFGSRPQPPTSPYDICWAQQSVLRFPQVDLGHLVSQSVISPKYSGPRIIADIPIEIDWPLKIQNTDFVCIKFPPPILSPLHSTRIYLHTYLHIEVPRQI